MVVPNIPPPYSCQTILFRAIPYDNLLFKKTGEHKPNVFFRRASSDPHGLSLVDSIQGCKDVFGLPIFGVRSIHVGAMLDLNQDLWLFPDADAPSHANIRHRNGDLTPRLVDNDPECRNLADDLMRISRPVEYWHEENADERFQAELAGKRAGRAAD
jgi:hypothetical protein